MKLFSAAGLENPESLMFGSLTLPAKMLLLAKIRQMAVAATKRRTRVLCLTLSPPLSQ
jgi:hypothetical protein